MSCQIWGAPHWDLLGHDWQGVESCQLHLLHMSFFIIYPVRIGCVRWSMYEALMSSTCRNVSAHVGWFGVLEFFRASLGVFAFTLSLPLCSKPGDKG